MCQNLRWCPISALMRFGLGFLWNQGYKVSGPRPRCSASAALTQLPLREATWLQSMLPKRQGYTKPCHLSTLHSLASCKTFRSYSESGHSNPNQQSCSPALLKSCKPKSIKTFLKTCTSLNLTIGTASAKSDRRGKKNCAIPTMFSFTLKNDGSNSPNNSLTS
jgi:hypothetical protein